MRPLQDDVVDNILFPIDEPYSPANQADAVFNVSPVSGINDSAYNPFPASPSYMQGGFAPTVVEEPIYYAPSPVYERPYQPEPIDVIAPMPIYEEPIYKKAPMPIYEEPIYAAPIYQQPIDVISDPIPTPRLGKCMRVIFSANRGFSAQAYWTDCSGVKRGQFVSVNETLEVDALDGTASGLPFMTYPLGHSPIPPAYEPVPPMEQPQPYKPPYEPVPVPQPIPIQEYPVDPIFLLPINPNLPQVPPRDFPHQCPDGTITYDDCAPTPVQTPAPAPTTPVVEPTPVDAIKTGVMPPDYIEDGKATQVDVTPTTPVVQTITPETPTLPTKAVSKDLKPYIIAGIAVVGILIASRLLSKK